MSKWLVLFSGLLTIPMINKSLVFFSTLVFALLVSPVAHAQTKLGLEPDKWARLFTDEKLNGVNSLGSLTTMLIETDSLRAFHFLDSLERSPNAKGYVFQTFYSMLKADFLFAKFAGYDKFKDGSSKKLEPIKTQILNLYAHALDAAYHLEKNLLTGWVCFYSAKRMRYFGDISRAVMYSKNGVDLFEQENYSIEPPVYTDLAELLYQVEEYGEALKYAKRGLEAWKNPDHERNYPASYKFKVKALNIIGNSFYKKDHYDSAMGYYRRALRLANDHNDTLLTAHVMGNMGRIMYSLNKFDSASTLFNNDYQTSKNNSVYNEAANASLWLARVNLARGNKAAALGGAKEAFLLLKLWPSGPYLADTYQTLTQVYRAMGKYDSAFYYGDYYLALHDSLQKEVATSSLAISKARLNDEVSRFNIQKINRQKQAELLWRNNIIVFILLGSVLALLITNRQRLREKIKTESALQEKKLIEQEMHSANIELKMFTAHIVEKTHLIEKLEDQLKGRENLTDQQAIIAELTRQTILTEDDWNLFKSLLEKIYPAFFHRLKEQYSGITVAEQRMAAMLKLRLTTRETAAMLGISVESSRKTRQRLKQRLNLPADVKIEEYVASF